MSRDLKKKCPRCNLFRRKTKGSRQSYQWAVDSTGQLVCYVCREKDMNKDTSKKTPSETLKL